MRRLIFAGILALWPALAHADESIAGQWQADLGHGVIIAMDVLADGHWTSQTVQDDQVVAQLAGTYQQTKKTDKSGQLVFLPVSSKTSGEHGPAVTEIDEYTIDNRADVLTLVTGGETMEFHKQVEK